MSLTFPLPEGSSDVIGSLQTVVVQRGETINNIARKYNVGFLEILEANPKVKFEYLRSGTGLVVPTKYILPRVPRRDIVINLAELRLYYFPPNERVVMTYPIGIGREGDDTPILETKIAEKRENPAWIPTKDTREKELLRGIVLPDFIEPGPQNPLGDYAIRIGWTNYLIHGTNDPGGVGLRISGGCIRMYPEDIEQLFQMVKIGTGVNIINHRIKLGWEGDTLYAEAHVPVDKKHSRSKKTLKPMSQVLMSEIKKFHVEIDWDKALAISKDQRGIPEPIGKMMYE